MYTQAARRYLRRKAVLEKFGIANSTLYQWVQDRAFPQPKKIGPLSLWPEDELDAWFTAQTQSQAGQATAA